MPRKKKTATIATTSPNLAPAPDWTKTLAGGHFEKNMGGFGSAFTYVVNTDGSIDTKFEIGGQQVKQRFTAEQVKKLRGK